MARTLVINGADFSTNKLDTVTFLDIPCTGISIDQTKSITGIGNTETLVPVLTPSDTTDTVMWASTDNTVATVSGGVITSKSSGTAIITATCGSYSATCTVTVTIPVVAAKNGLICLETPTSATFLDFAALSNTSSNRFISAGTSDNGYPAVGKIDSGEFAPICPYPIPEGAKTITVSKTGLAPLIVYYNSKVKSTDESVQKIRDCAKVLSGETPSGGTPWSISAWTYDERTFTIPSIEGIDSFTLGFYTKAASDYTDFDASNPGIGITFGYDD